MNHPMNPIRVQYFRCNDTTMRKYGKWGFKVRYNDALIHKTKYDFDTREDAVRAAKEWVDAEYPGRWEEKRTRRAA